MLQFHLPRPSAPFGADGKELVMGDKASKAGEPSGEPIYLEQLETLDSPFTQEMLLRVVPPGSDKTLGESIDPELLEAATGLVQISPDFQMDDT